MPTPQWPTAVTFDVIDETSTHRHVKQVLIALGPAVADALSLVIGPTHGTAPPVDVKVLLSDIAAHDARFPPSVEPGLGDPDPDDPHSGPTVERIVTRGVTTTGAGVTNRPPGIADDDLVVALCVERLTAGHRGCGPDASVATTFIHEMAHVWQMLSNVAATPWFIEGDAQRTTWEVLKRIVLDPTHRDLARRAQTMMLRLAPSQPAAYRMFPFDQTHYYRVQHGPLPGGQHWMIEAYDLHQYVDTEADVVVPDAVQFGDTVHLANLGQFIGSFVVTERNGGTAHLVPDGPTRRGLNSPKAGLLNAMPTTTERATTATVRLHELNVLCDFYDEALTESGKTRDSLRPEAIAAFQERDDLRAQTRPAPPRSP